MIDHNLYTKYLKTGRLTLTRELKPLFTTQLDTTQDNTYTLYMATYHDTTTLHDNLVISYLRLLMSWYGKGEGDTPNYRTPWFIWDCHMSTLYTLLHF